MGICVFLSRLGSRIQSLALTGQRCRCKLNPLRVISTNISRGDRTKTTPRFLPQVLLLRHHCEASALVQALVAYMALWPPSPRAWRSLALLLVALIASTFYLPVLWHSKTLEWVSNSNAEHCIKSLFPARRRKFEFHSF